MGGLEHFKQSLPEMVAQGANEVIIVDYSCPEGTGAFVEKQFPQVRLVPMPGEKHFSIPHDAASRTQSHAQRIAKSYAAGILYRAAKRAVLRHQGSVELSLGARTEIYETAKNAAAALGSESDRVSMNVKVLQDPVRMPRQLGYERGMQNLSVRVEVSLEGKLPRSEGLPTARVRASA